MSELSLQEFETNDFVESAPTKSGFDLAQLLRWLGCAGVILSAIVFLIQGFGDIGLALRNWAYLGLMILLGGVGVALKYAFEDGKGARLLLGLAVAVIPIQFAQLGGMIHSLVSGAGTDVPASLSGLIALGTVSWGMVFASGAATLALAFTIGLFGFRVLARPQAILLTTMYVALSATLLIPIRAGFSAVAIILALGTVTLLVDLRMTKAKAMLRTLEGRGARVLLLLPLLITGARSSFYVGDIAGLALLGGMISLVLLVGAYQYLHKGALRELVFSVGVLGVCGAWSIWSLSELSLAGSFQTLSLLGVEGLFLLAVSRLTPHGMVYRVFGSVLFGLAALQMLLSGYGIQTSVLALMLGVLLTAIGYLQKWRMPMLTGLGVVSIAIVPLTVQALVDVEFGTWVGLAIGGVSLVVLASIVERYGHAIAHYAQASWGEVKTWS